MYAGLGHPRDKFLFGAPSCLFRWRTAECRNAFPASLSGLHKILCAYQVNSANYHPATVGEAISLPPRGITACLVEWFMVQFCTNSPNKVHDWEAPLRGRMISSPTMAGQMFSPNYNSARLLSKTDKHKILGQHRTMGAAGFGGSFAPLCGVALEYFDFLYRHSQIIALFWENYTPEQNLGG